jgi:DNA-binding NarL/FixJ family response regulator
MIRILLFEDNADFVDSFQELIHDTPGMELVAVFSNCKEVVRQVKQHEPDIVLMDIDMPGKNGLDGLRMLRAAELETIVVMLTVFDDNDRVFQSVCNGASGYLLKSSTPDKIIEGIHEAFHGGAPMTPSVAKQVLKLFSAPFQKANDYQNLTAREHEVLSFLVRGYSYKMAAAEMNISIETLRFHIKNMYAKLHVNSKSEAVAKAIHNKLIGS